MNLYESHGVLDYEFECLVKESNDKQIEKFYAGADDVILHKPTDRKVLSCAPLLCPARVYYTSSDDERDSLGIKNAAGIDIRSYAYYLDLRFYFQ